MVLVSHTEDVQCGMARPGNPMISISIFGNALNSPNTFTGCHRLRLEHRLSLTLSTGGIGDGDPMRWTLD